MINGIFLIMLFFLFSTRIRGSVKKIGNRMLLRANTEKKNEIATKERDTRYFIYSVSAYKTTLAVEVSSCPTSQLGN